MASDYRFVDIRKLLERHGWELIRIKGSHHIFGGEKRRSIPIPVHKQRVKEVYFKQVQQAIRDLGEEGEGE